LRLIGTIGAPRCRPTFGVVRFASTMITSFPSSFSAVARLMDVVVFPTPPFPDVIVINLLICDPVLCSRRKNYLI